MDEEQEQLEAERASRALLVRRLDQIARGDDVIQDVFEPLVQDPPAVERATARKRKAKP